MWNVRTVYVDITSSSINFTWMTPYVSMLSFGQYMSHFLRPRSTKFVIITMMATLCSQIIRQKQSNVSGKGP